MSMDLFRLIKLEIQNEPIDKELLEKLYSLDNYIKNIHFKFYNNYKKYKTFTSDNNKRKCPKIFIIEDSNKIIKRINEVFNNTYFARAQTYQLQTGKNLKNKQKINESKASRAIDNLITIIDNISETNEKFETELKEQSLFRRQKWKEYEPYKNKTEKTLFELNKIYKSKNKYQTKVKLLIQKIKENTESYKLKLGTTKTKMRFYRHSKLKELILLQNLPTLELKNVNLRSHFKFNLHEDIKYLTTKHYNLIIDKLNIHIVPEKYDKELIAFLRKNIRSKKFIY